MVVVSVDFEAVVVVSVDVVAAVVVSVDNEVVVVVSVNIEAVVVVSVDADAAIAVSVEVGTTVVTLANARDDAVVSDKTGKPPDWDITDVNVVCVSTGAGVKIFTGAGLGCMDMTGVVVVETETGSSVDVTFDEDVASITAELRVVTLQPLLQKSSSQHWARHRSSGTSTYR